MNNKYNQALQTIKTCIENIETYIGSPQIFEHYNSSLITQQAVERNLEIIGEATKRLLDIDPNITISNTRPIINASNKIIHGYDEIENPQIWGIIIKHLPILKQEIEALLNN
ncbi:DUF86 domain-containing protein [Parasediminibacterium sp. JCM 36343]|uniref:HepT-like ribonuclease domain-containing protein n=1 Tax=Parasediminibacterium sp. JCM 36343 TaxID=3374279 RepID=UPI00397C7782